MSKLRKKRPFVTEKPAWHWVNNYSVSHCAHIKKNGASIGMRWTYEPKFRRMWWLQWYMFDMFEPPR